jgi:hypothetical protein
MRAFGQARKLLGVLIVELDVESLHRIRDGTRRSRCRVGAAGARANGPRPYRSRLGDEIVNWAIFEPSAGKNRLREPHSEPIDPDDSDLIAVLELLGIELVD